MKINDRVVVERQVGKNGLKIKTFGIIKKFSNIITIGGEYTAFVNYDNSDEGYYYPLSKIELK
jgi:hypothetical protein